MRDAIPSPPRILGRLLRESGHVSVDALEAALDEQQRSGGRLGAVLVSSGALDPEDLARTLARQLDLPHAPPPLEPDGEILPEAVARSARILALGRSGRTLRLGMEDPLDLATAEDVRFRTGLRVEPVVVSTPALDQGLDRAYGDEVGRLAADLALPADREEDREALERAARAAPVVRLVDRVLDGAIADGASDVHVEPDDDGLLVRLRVDGVLRPAHLLPGGARAAVLSRLKIMAGMDIAVRLRPQDGGMERTMRGRRTAMRVSTLPCETGEKAVVRILDTRQAPTGLDDLGLAPADRERVRRLVAARQGVVLAAGPTGSGKSSTLQAALRELDRERLNVVTLEDPVEYRTPGVTHVQVHPRAGLDFPAALRAVLRQDPDVVMVGEIRDRETAEIAMAAAVTGHLVLSTIHTTDAPGAVTRLLHMGVPSYLVAGGLTGVVAQRLVRTVCPTCRGRRTDGCGRCRDGFAGRTGVFQVLVMDDELRDLVVEGAAADELGRRAARAGMGTLADDVRRKVAEGVTTPHEAARILRSDPGASRPCPRCDQAVPADARACPWCGHRQRRYCACGTVLRGGWRYCPACVRKAPAPDP